MGEERMGEQTFTPHAHPPIRVARLPPAIQIPRPLHGVEERHEGLHDVRDIPRRQGLCNCMTVVSGLLDGRWERSQRQRVQHALLQGPCHCRRQLFAMGDQAKSSEPGDQWVVKPADQ